MALSLILGQNSEIRRVMNKKEIRKDILKVRSELPVEERARCHDIIREYILTHPVYIGAQAILAYASYQSEVDTTAWIKQALDDGKSVFAPKVSGDEMEFWQITSVEDLKEGYRGIPEPTERVSFPAWLDMQLQDKNAQECMYGEGNFVSRKWDEDDGKMTFRIMMWMPGLPLIKRGIVSVTAKDFMTDICTG